MRSFQRSATHAESMPPPHGDTSQAETGEDQAVEKVAAAIERAGMAGIAPLILHAFKPLSWVGGQFIYLFQPFMGSTRHPSDVAQFLEGDRNIDMLIARLDAGQRRERR